MDASITIISSSFPLGYLFSFRSASGNTLYGATIESIVDAGQGVPTAQPIVAFLINQITRTVLPVTQLLQLAQPSSTAYRIQAFLSVQYQYYLCKYWRSCNHNDDYYTGSGVGSPTTSPL